MVAENLGRRILEALGNGAPATANDADPLVVALREWRAEASRQAGIPDYGILGDDAIVDLARIRPAEISALRRISGVGPRFLRKWGREVLALIQRVGVESRV
jgi:superfamily II DNA helicase RecQ